MSCNAAFSLKMTFDVSLNFVPPCGFKGAAWTNWAMKTFPRPITAFFTSRTHT